jgi:putative CocE/NonD family hydrolase
MLFAALQQRGVPAHLLEGPWYHNTPGEGLPAAGTGIPSLEEIELRWDEHYVKGLPDPGLDDGTAIPPVTAYENGADVWRTADSWPAADVHPVALHLGGASPGTNGTLVVSRPAASPPDKLPFNPATGACTRSTGQWTAGEGVGTRCDTDNTANDAGALAYDLPITQPLHLNGTINAHLEVSSLQGRDGMITARLEDVTPGANGKVTQISAGWQVLSFRALDTARTITQDGLVWKPYHPFTSESVAAMPTDDSPVAVDVEIFPTTWMVAAGHTLRLTLQTADSPHLTAPAPQAAGSGGLLSIHHDATHDSYLTLPVRG